MAPIPTDSAGALSFRVIVAMMTLVFVSLGLRIWAKCTAKAGFHLDDLLIGITALVYCANQGVFLSYVLGGGISGRFDVDNTNVSISLSTINGLMPYTYAAGILCIICISVVKLSVLAFYYRIFPVPWFRRITWTLVVMSITWAAVILVVFIMQCRPIHVFWHVELQFTLSGRPKCINTVKMLFCLEISNMALDLSILASPIRIVQGLQLPTVKKASVIGIFLLGSCQYLFFPPVKSLTGSWRSVCATCAVRAYFLWDPVTDTQRSASAVMDFTTVEQALSIVCACLPTYGPLLRSSVLPSWLKRWYGSSRSRSLSLPTCQEGVAITLPEYHRLNEWSRNSSALRVQRNDGNPLDTGPAAERQRA
ncbi:hypothetical protein BJX99DRAFT_259958 [Aspergillus californicus]